MNPERLGAGRSRFQQKRLQAMWATRWRIGRLEEFRATWPPERRPKYPDMLDSLAGESEVPDSQEIFADVDEIEAAHALRCMASTDVTAELRKARGPSVFLGLCV